MSPRSNAAAALALAALAACSGRSDPAPVTFRGSDPSGAASASRGLAPLPPAAPVAVAEVPLGTATPLGSDGSGVIDYGGYRAIVAREGDTVESMAARAGLAPSALAAYNGLPAQHVPRAGDELILPPDAGPAPAPAAIAALPSVAPAPRPEPPTTVATVAPQAPPPTAGAVRLDLDRIEAEVAAPPVDAPPVEAPPRAEPSAAPSAVAAVEPPSETAALVETPAPAPVAPPPAPTPARAGATFAAPVDGRIVRGYGESAGGGKSDGVDFSAPKGAPVRASADGEVALVSQSLGGLGTIVLIRHENQLLTVYGRVDGVTVKRGDKVRRGDVIGAVAPGADGREPSLHFEVRRGAESVDPGEFLG